MWPKAGKFVCFLTLCLYPLSLVAQEAKVSYGSLTLSGLLQVWYDYTPDRSQKSGDTFRLRRTEVKFSGVIKPDRIKYFLMLDPASVPNTIIQDAVVAFVFPFGVELHAGQEKAPVSEEGLRPTPQIDFVERSILALTFGEQRNIGLQVWGQRKEGEVRLAVINGTGRNRLDNNRQRDFVGRVVVKPVPEVSLGFSGYTGKTTVQKSSGPDSLRFDKWSVGGEVGFDWRNWRLRGEILRGHGGKDDKDQTQEGFSGYLRFTYRDRVQTAFRLERWDVNIHQGGDRQDVVTLGAGYLFDSFHARVLANYLVKQEERGRRISNNQLQVLLQEVF